MDGGYKGTGAEGMSMSRKNSCGVLPPPLQHPSVPGLSSPGKALPLEAYPSCAPTAPDAAGALSRRKEAAPLLMHSPEKATLLPDSVTPAPSSPTRLSRLLRTDGRGRPHEGCRGGRGCTVIWGRHQERAPTARAGSPGGLAAEPPRCLLGGMCHRAWGKAVPRSVF